MAFEILKVVCLELGEVLDRKGRADIKVDSIRIFDITSTEMDCCVTVKSEAKGKSHQAVFHSLGKAGLAFEFLKVIFLELGEVLDRKGRWPSRLTPSRSSTSHQKKWIFV